MKASSCRRRVEDAPPYHLVKRVMSERICGGVGGELGVVLVVLLALRAVDRCVQSSFHGWCFFGDNIIR